MGRYFQFPVRSLMVRRNNGVRVSIHLNKLLIWSRGYRPIGIDLSWMHLEAERFVCISEGHRKAICKEMPPFSKGDELISELTGRRRLFPRCEHQVSFSHPAHTLQREQTGFSINKYCSPHRPHFLQLNLPSDSLASAHSEHFESRHGRRTVWL